MPFDTIAFVAAETEPAQKALPDVFAWTGIASAFAKAGFVEVARRSRTRPIYRLVALPEGPVASARGRLAAKLRTR